MEKNKSGRILLLILATTALLVSSSCKQNDGANQEPDPRDTNALLEDTIAIDNLETESPEKHAFAEFSASKGEIMVRLRDWRKNLPMENLGTLQDTTVKVLGHGADTHIGAAIHTYTYDGMTMQFFGPKQNAENWLLQMDITGDEWSTARGIRVGDPVTDIKTLYPKADNTLTGDTSVYRYEVNESTLEFHTSNEKVSRILMRYNIP